MTWKKPFFILIYYFGGVDAILLCACVEPQLILNLINEQKM